MSDFECLPVGTAARLAELEAENRGLRFALSRQGKSTMPEMVALRAEVERLAAGHCLVPGGIVADEGGTPYCTMKAEVERLRALLLLARDAIDIAGYGTRMAPEVRDTLLQIDTALKEGQR